MTTRFRKIHALGELADSDPPGARAVRYLHPGESLATAQPTAVTTILASGVAVCLWDPELRLGGLTHFLLPNGTRNAAAPERHGSLAIPRLFDDLTLLGAHKKRLRAKVFGGSCRTDAPRGADLGARNLQLAEELLRDEDVPIIASDVGGARARKLVLHTDDFSAWVWRI